MINRELFFSLEFIINTASQLQTVATTLQNCNEVVAIKSGWTCEGLPIGGVDHDYTFDPNIREREVDAFMAKLGEVIKAGGYHSLTDDVTKRGKQANQLAEDVAEATGGK
jgi:hypothetical protein